MTIYRKNTMSDKSVSFISILLALLLFSNSVKMYKLIGKMYPIDIAISVGALIIGGLFLYTSKLKYIELTKESFTWYTWFFIKHSIDLDNVKEIEAKTYYIILKKANNKEEWIPTRCVKSEELNELLECLKAKVE